MKSTLSFCLLALSIGCGDGQPGGAGSGHASGSKVQASANPSSSASSNANPGAVASAAASATPSEGALTLEDGEAALAKLNPFDPSLNGPELSARLDAAFAICGPFDLPPADGTPRPAWPLTHSLCKLDSLAKLYQLRATSEDVKAADRLTTAWALALTAAPKMATPAPGSPESDAAFKTAKTLKFETRMGLITGPDNAYNAALQAQIDSFLPYFGACSLIARHSNPTVSERIYLDISLDAEGRSTAVKAHGNPTAEKATPCAVAVARAFRFPKPTAATSINIPILIQNRSL